MSKYLNFGWNLSRILGQPIKAVSDIGKIKFLKILGIQILKHLVSLDKWLHLFTAFLMKNFPCSKSDPYMFYFGPIVLVSYIGAGMFVTAFL